MRITLFILSVLLTLSARCQSLDNFSIETKLDYLSSEYPGLEELSEIKVNQVGLREFITGLGSNHQVNLTVDPEVQETISYNFKKVSVSDVILFVCREYDLTLEVTGSIIHLKKRPIPPPPPQPKKKKVLPKVSFIDSSGLVSLDLRQDTLQNVLKEISRLSEINVVTKPEFQDKQITLFINNETVESALHKISFVANLELFKSDEYGYYIEEPPRKPIEDYAETSRLRGSSGLNKKNGIWFSARTGLQFDVAASDITFVDLLDHVSNELGVTFIMKDKLEGTTSFYLENVTFEGFLTLILDGTAYGFTRSDDVYIIGNETEGPLRKSELFKLENRTIENLQELIPKSMLENVDMVEYPDLNGFILSGGSNDIRRLKSILRELDQVVPVINIEVLIVDINKSRSTSAGIRAGIGGENVPASTTGTLSPGFDFTFNSTSVNNLVNSFNGLGVINIGKVTPDFYLSMSAAESDGLLSTKSTPKLATLNGHEANLRIGRTEYYLEVQNNIIGAQNPTVATSQNFKSVSADLSVTIKPTASSDNQVTMSIEVSQSDFTERINETAPPGTVDRTFRSIIRVKDGEMVVLGGLENTTKERTGSGIPFLNRIPVLRWIFGYRTSKKEKSRLNIFIKPTVQYQ